METVIQPRQGIPLRRSDKVMDYLKFTAAEQATVNHCINRYSTGGLFIRIWEATKRALGFKTTWQHACKVLEGRVEKDLFGTKELRERFGDTSRLVAEAIATFILKHWVTLACYCQKNGWWAPIDFNAWATNDLGSISYQYLKEKTLTAASPHWISQQGPLPQ